MFKLIFDNFFFFSTLPNLFRILNPKLNKF